MHELEMKLYLSESSVRINLKKLVIFEEWRSAWHTTTFFFTFSNLMNGETWTEILNSFFMFKCFASFVDLWLLFCLRTLDTSRKDCIFNIRDLTFRRTVLLGKRYLKYSFLNQELTPESGFNSLSNIIKQWFMWCTTAPIFRRCVKRYKMLNVYKTLRVKSWKIIINRMHTTFVYFGLATITG